MAKKTKYYVVWKGAKPGIYDSWKACAEQVHGYPDARYKSFPTLKEAEAAFKTSPSSHIQSRKTSSKSKVSPTPKSHGIIRDSISVDAACSGNPGIMEYRGVSTSSGEEIFHLGPFRDGTNNIGEFLAIVHALALLHKNDDKTTPIYSDSRVAQGWVKAGKAKTKLERTRKNHELFVLIERAERWLASHTWTNPVLKWETALWGEIPADFGRK